MGLLEILFHVWEKLCKVFVAIRLIRWYYVVTRLITNEGWETAREAYEKGNHSR